jgi:hypothetical protein
MNTYAESWYRYGDYSEATPIHLAYDVVLYIFPDFSSVIEYMYMKSGVVILSENIWPEKFVAVDETAPRTTYSLR